jgi:hypothetical protein
VRDFPPILGGHNPCPSTKRNHEIQLLKAKTLEKGTHR